MDESPELAALKAAISKAGTQQVLASKLGIGQGAVSNWVKAGRVPLKRVLEVERATGVARARLRPDLYAPMRRPSTATRKSLGR
jgi:DNA-binding transcriptional regulator YdaS (Cro superfamily)